MAMVEKKPATADNLGASGNPWDCVWHHSHNCPTSTAWGTPDSELRGWAEPSVARLVRGARAGRRVGGTLLGDLYSYCTDVPHDR